MLIVFFYNKKLLNYNSEKGKKKEVSVYSNFIQSLINIVVKVYRTYQAKY